MHIKILGPGCPRCAQVEKTAKEVVQELGLKATIEKVKDINKIMEYPILRTPGLVLDEELVCSGRVPTRGEVTEFIKKASEK